MSGDKSHCCKCVKEMAEQFKKFRDQSVVVYEKNSIILGTIEKVKDDSILVLKDAIKFTFSGGVIIFTITFEKLFVSICEITEFAAPVPYPLRDTLLNNLNQLNSIKLL